MALKDYIPINWDLIKQPLNWVIVLLMILIFAFAVDIVLSHVTGGGAKDLPTGGAAA